MADAQTVRVVESQASIGTDFQDQVMIDRIPGVYGWVKFGYRQNLLSASGEETIWNTSGNFTPQSFAEIYNLTYNPATDGAGTTGARSIKVWYVADDGRMTTHIHQLGNSGNDTMAISGFGINRMSIASTGANKINGSELIAVGSVSGLKAAAIAPLAGTVNHPIFVMGNNHIGVGKLFVRNIGKPAGGGNVKILLRGYIYDRFNDTVRLIYREIIDTTSSTTPPPVSEPIGVPILPGEVLYFTADTDTNGADMTLWFSLNVYDRKYS